MARWDVVGVAVVGTSQVRDCPCLIFPERIWCVVRHMELVTKRWCTCFDAVVVGSVLAQVCPSIASSVLISWDMMSRDS